MALLFGTNFMASDIAKILEQNDIQQNGIRTWRKLFGNASLGYNAQRGTLKSDYSDVIAQAYKSNLAQQNAVASAGLNLGATNELMGLTQQDLHNTYQTYMNNYKQSLSALDENYSNEVTSLNEALLERAQNYADYFSAGVDYFYNHLTGSTYNGADYFSDKGMDWLWENTPDKSLASREQLMNMLFDENGTLTKEGTQFFDAIYNATPYGYTRDDGSRTMSFDEWLSNENSDLREWAASIDNFNYNFARTNKGTANILSGRESTDEKYHRGEYLPGNASENMQYEYILPTSKNMSDLLTSWVNWNAAGRPDPVHKEAMRGPYLSFYEGYRAQAPKEDFESTKSAAADLTSQYLTYMSQYMLPEEYEKLQKDERIVELQKKYQSKIDAFVKSYKDSINNYDVEKQLNRRVALSNDLNGILQQYKDELKKISKSYERTAKKSGY